jgi:hypothetical protein
MYEPNKIRFKKNVICPFQKSFKDLIHHLIFITNIGEFLHSYYDETLIYIGNDIFSCGFVFKVRIDSLFSKIQALIFLVNLLKKQEAHDSEFFTIYMSCVQICKVSNLIIT